METIQFFNPTETRNFFMNVAQALLMCASSLDVQRLGIDIRRVDPAFIQRRGQTKNFEYFVHRILQGDGRRAMLHLRRIQKNIHAVANDFPFTQGDVVSVIRTEHGWYDGAENAKITEVHCQGGKWSYTAQMLDNKNRPIKDYFVDICHTRDACVVSKF